MERFYDKLICIEEDFNLSGDYHTAQAEQLVMTFEVCIDPKGTTRPKCKDYETFIKPWMRRKFMFTLENQTRFQKNNIEDEVVKRVSSIRYNVLSP